MARKPESNAVSPKLALRQAEAAAALGISLRSLMAMVGADEIPHVRLHRRSSRFPIKQLEAWLAQESQLGGGTVVQQQITEDIHAI